MSVVVSLALETYVPTAGGGGLGRENSDFCLISGIPSWLMPLRDRSGLSWLNLTPQRGQSDHGTFKVRWNLSDS